MKELEHRLRESQERLSAAEAQVRVTHNLSLYGCHLVNSDLAIAQSADGYGPLPRPPITLAEGFVGLYRVTYE